MMARKWEQLGWETGTLGYPVKEEYAVTVRMQSGGGGTRTLGYHQALEELGR